MPFRALTAMTALLATPLMIALPLAAAQAQATPAVAQISFDRVVHDFGLIAVGGNGNGTMAFTNTGKSPLVISNVQASCGCLKADWPKTPIKPGGRAEIKFRYDTQRVGGFMKTMTVSSNAADKPNVVLTVKGTVEPAG